MPGVSDIKITSRRRRTVVLAEDDAAVGAHLTQVLSDAGWEVHPAANVDAVLRSFEHPPGNVPPDALVYDPLLPGAGGMGLARSMQQHWPNVPVVLLTTRSAAP